MKTCRKNIGRSEILEIDGRIDGLTAPALRSLLEEMAGEGKRTIILGMSGVTFLSSAGLRVILQAHKSLKQISGELILLSPQIQVMDVFSTSGVASFLNLFDTLRSFETRQQSPAESMDITEFESGDMHFSTFSPGESTGTLVMVGDPGKLRTSGYDVADNRILGAGQMRFGAGLAALGDSSHGISDLYGETITLEHNLFCYPAVKDPSVDYLLFSDESHPSLNFLYGFGITGNFSRMFSFECRGLPISLQDLTAIVTPYARTTIFGAVILARSGGIQWMHLRKSPVIKNRPASGNIFDPEHFPGWFNFSVEEEDINKTILACGIIVSDASAVTVERMGLMPRESNIHFHAAVFRTGLWSSRILKFEEEIRRIPSEFEAEKVVHLLPGSRLYHGLIGIINLGNC